MGRQSVLNRHRYRLRGKRLMVTMKPRPLHFTLTHSCCQNQVFKVTTLCILFIHLLQSISGNILYFNIFVFRNHFLLNYYKTSYPKAKCNNQEDLIFM